MTVAELQESTSKSLISGLRLGDPMAFTRVSMIYGPLIMFWCKSKFKLDHQDAEDVCQEVLVNVVRYGTSFEKRAESGGFRKWLYTITRFDAIRYVEKNRHKLSLDPNVIDRLISEKASNDEDPDDSPEVLDELLRRAMLVVKNSCTPRNWEIFLAAIEKGYDYGEVARRFANTAGNVRLIKCRLLARLRDNLELTDDTDCL